MAGVPPERVDPKKLKELIAGKSAFVIVSFGSLLLLGRWTGVNVWKPSGLKGIGLFAVCAAAGILADRIIQRFSAARLSLSSQPATSVYSEEAAGTVNNEIAELTKQLKTGDPYARQCAADQLIKIGRPAVDVLIPLLRDHDEDVRWRAAAALGSICDPALSNRLSKH